MISDRIILYIELMVAHIEKMLYLLTEHITYVVLLPRLTTTTDSIIFNFSRFRKGKQGASRLFPYHLLTNILPSLDIAKPIDLQYNGRRRNFW